MSPKDEKIKELKEKMEQDMKQYLDLHEETKIVLKMK
jgi:hypothetical protein